MALETELAYRHSSEGDVQALRAELESDYRDRLAFKDSEIESANNKLSRISQSNIEFKTRCDRLEAANAELAGVNEQQRARTQTLEMELEMTKVNSERDSE